MKLREPRTKIPPSTWSRDILKLFHPMMFAPILMLVVIGSFLAEEVHYDRLILTLIGVFFAVLSAYHLDERFEKVTAPNVPVLHNGIIASVSLVIGLSIGIYFLFQTPMVLIPLLIALWGILLYNMDIIKSRILYCLSWGGTPVFGSYMVQTGAWPNLTVLVFTVFAMLLSVKLFWNWSLRTCGRWTVCGKREKGRNCHSPGTVCCFDRVQMPKQVNDTTKILQRLDLLILLSLTIGVVIL